MFRPDSCALPRSGRDSRAPVAPSSRYSGFLRPRFVRPPGHESCGRTGSGYRRRARSACRPPGGHRPPRPQFSGPRRWRSSSHPLFFVRAMMMPAATRPARRRTCSRRLWVRTVVARGLLWFAREGAPWGPKRLRCLPTDLVFGVWAGRRQAARPAGWLDGFSTRAGPRTPRPARCASAAGPSSGRSACPVARAGRCQPRRAPRCARARQRLLASGRGPVVSPGVPATMRADTRLMSASWNRPSNARAFRPLNRSYSQACPSRSRSRAVFKA